MVTTTQAVGLKVLEALGLPAKQCAGVTIKILPNDAVRVIAEYYPDEGPFMDTIEIIRESLPKEA